MIFGITATICRSKIVFFKTKRVVVGVLFTDAAKHILLSFVKPISEKSLHFKPDSFFLKYFYFTIAHENYFCCHLKKLISDFFYIFYNIIRVVLKATPHNILAKIKKRLAFGLVFEIII